MQLCDGPWQLFGLRKDRCEVNDLAIVHKPTLTEFIQKWNAFATKSGMDPAASPTLQTQHGCGKPVHVLNDSAYWWRFRTAR